MKYAVGGELSCDFLDTEEQRWPDQLRLSPVERGILPPRGEPRYFDQQSASQERLEKNQLNSDLSLKYLQY
jgi:hypothetical protein